MKQWLYKGKASITLILRCIRLYLVQLLYCRHFALYAHCLICACFIAILTGCGLNKQSPVPFQRPIDRLYGHAGAIFRLDYHPDGVILASGSSDATVRIWDSSNGRDIVTLPSHNSNVYGLSFSGDGALLATGSWDGAIRIWQTKDWKLLRSLHTPDNSPITCMAFDPVRRKLAVGMHVTASPIAFFYLNDDDRMDIPMKVKGAIGEIAFSSSGEWFAASQVNGSLRVWGKGGLGKEIVLQERMNGSKEAIAFSPGGAWFVRGGARGDLILYETANWRQVWSVPGDGQESITCLAFSSDGRNIFVGTETNNIGWLKVICTKTGSLQNRIALFNGGPECCGQRQVLSLAVSDSGKQIAAGGIDSSLVLMNAGRIGQAQNNVFVPLVRR